MRRLEKEPYYPMTISEELVEKDEKETNLSVCSAGRPYLSEKKNNCYGPVRGINDDGNRRSRDEGR